MESVDLSIQDLLELAEIKDLLQAGNKSGILARLQRLAANYPGSVEIKDLIRFYMSVPETPPTNNQIAAYPTQMTVLPKHVGKSRIIFWGSVVGCFAVIILVFVASNVLLSALAHGGIYDIYREKGADGIDSYNSLAITISGTTRFILAGIVFGTSLWAALDSAAIRKKYGNQAFTDPLTSFISCLMIWFIFFPQYLANRYKVAVIYKGR